MTIQQVKMLRTVVYDVQYDDQLLIRYDDQVLKKIVIGFLVQIPCIN